MDADRGRAEYETVGAPRGDDEKEARDKREDSSEHDQGAGAPPYSSLPRRSHDFRR
jgi:hypothetical protein